MHVFPCQFSESRQTKTCFDCKQARESHDHAFQAIFSGLDSENNGFSLNADVKVEAFDRVGLEKLVRYCARPEAGTNGLFSYIFCVVSPP